MRQRLNYTNRKRITLDLVGFRLVEAEDEVRLFTEKLDLSGLGLPAEASVGVMVRQARAFETERITCGTIGDLRPPAGHLLQFFTSAAGLSIKVAVVGVAGEQRGMIVAHARNVRPIIEAPGQTDLERIPLLPFMPDELGNRLWALDLEDSEGPVVRVNKALGNWRSLVRSESFQLLVFPEIAEQVAKWFLISSDDEVEDHGPLAQWSVFFENLEPGVRVGRPDDEDDVHVWATGRSRQLAETLGQRMDLMERGMLLLQGEDE
jgi:hypothetical protein